MAQTSDLLKQEGAAKPASARIIAILEVALVYVIIRALGTALRSTGLMDAELETLGWSYSGMALFVAVPAVVIWLTHRRWADYGVSLVNWQTNLDIGMKAYLVAFIPLIAGLGGTVLLKTSYRSLGGGLLVGATEVIAIALMLWLLRRQKPVTASRQNLIVLGLLLLFPVVTAILMNRLTLIIVSTVVWQFLFSGFGEEFAWRGYLQSRLNQAFGRPYQLFGVQFGPGLILASLLFGLTHAFNTYDPAAGRYELAWGWAIWTSLAGLLFGILREKTGSLLAGSIAHGLPDAVGEALAKIFGWM